MAFEPTDKEQLLEGLMSTRRQCQLAEVSLRLHGKTAEAETLSERNARLSTEIDILLGRIMDEWLGSADQAIQRLTAANAMLEAAVAEIKKEIAVAQNVVTALGVLDDAVAIAKKVFAAM